MADGIGSSTTQRSVVVGWDGSPAAAHAAGWAAERQRGGGRLQLLHVLPEPDADEARAARSAMAGHLARLRRDHPGIDIDGAVEVGSPLHRLAEAAEEQDALVVGEPARAGRRSTFGRPFAVRVAEATRGPVFVVPDPATTRHGDRVVVGVDGSEAGIHAALAAATEAERRDESLTVVHAWWLTIGWDAKLPLAPHVLDALEAAHRTVLDESADVVARHFPHLELARVLVHARPVPALTETSEHASVLVLGRHSGAVALPMLLGSVVRGVLERTDVPVLVAGAGQLPLMDDTLGEPALSGIDAPA